MATSAKKAVKKAPVAKAEVKVAELCLTGEELSYGHSRKKPVCLHALMHGGYSPSSKYWGTPFVKLVVQG